MNPEQFVKDLYHDIWQGHDISKIVDYYAKDIKAVVNVSQKAGEIEDIELTYDDIVKQADWQKATYHDIHFDFKSIFANDKQNKMSLYFHSSVKDRKTGEVFHYRVSGEYHLNEEGKVQHVIAVMLPFYPFKH